MRLLIAVPATGYHDKELSQVIAVLDANNMPYDLISNEKGMAKGTFGGRVAVNLTFEDVLLSDAEGYDGIIILGGNGCQQHFWPSSDLHELLRLMRMRKKVIGGISTAPVAIARAGILKKRAATVMNGPPIRELMKYDAKFEDKPLVFLDRIVTARDPTQAKRFAEIVIEYMLGNPEFKGPQIIPAPNKIGFDI